jgi:response regulator of citrate/malate metabolism
MRCERCGGPNPQSPTGRRSGHVRHRRREAALASGQPMTNEQLAKAVGVSTRTARRYRSRLTPMANGHHPG